MPILDMIEGLLLLVLVVCQPLLLALTIHYLYLVWRAK